MSALPTAATASMEDVLGRHSLRRVLATSATAISQRLHSMIIAARSTSAVPAALLAELSRCGDQVDTLLSEMLSDVAPLDEDMTSERERKQQQQQLQSSPTSTPADAAGGRSPPSAAAAYATVQGDWRSLVASLQRRVQELTTDINERNTVIEAMRTRHAKRERSFDAARSALLAEVSHLRTQLSMNPDHGQEAALLDMFLMLGDVADDKELGARVTQMVALLSEERVAMESTQAEFKQTSSELRRVSEELEYTKRAIRTSAERASVEQQRLKTQILSLDRELESRGAENADLMGEIAALKRQLAHQADALASVEAERDELRLVRLAVERVQANERDKHALTIATLVADLDLERNKNNTAKWKAPGDVDALRIAKEIAAKRSALHLDKETLDRIVAAAAPPDDPRLVSSLAAHREKLVFLEREADLWRQYAVEGVVRERQLNEVIEELRADIATCCQTMMDRGVGVPVLKSEQLSMSSSAGPSSGAGRNAAAGGPGGKTTDVASMSENELRHTLMVVQSTAAGTARKLAVLKDRMRILLRQVHRDVPLPEAARSGAVVEYDSEDDDEGSGPSPPLNEVVNVLESRSFSVLKTLSHTASELAHTRDELAIQRTAMEDERRLWTQAWQELMAQLPPTVASKLLGLGPAAALKLRPVTDVLFRAVKQAEEQAAKDVAAAVAIEQARMQQTLQQLESRHTESSERLEGTIRQLQTSLAETQAALAQAKQQAAQAQAAAPPATGAGGKKPGGVSVVPRQVAGGPPATTTQPVALPPAKPLAIMLFSSTQTDPVDVRAIVTRDEKSTQFAAIEATPPTPGPSTAPGAQQPKRPVRPNGCQVSLPCPECVKRESTEYLFAETQTDAAETDSVACGVTPSATRPPSRSSPAMNTQGVNAGSGLVDRGCSAMGDSVSLLLASPFHGDASWSRRGSSQVATLQDGTEGLLQPTRRGSSRRASALPPMLGGMPGKNPGVPASLPLPREGALSASSQQDVGPTTTSQPSSPQRGSVATPTLLQAQAAAQSLRELMDRVETAVREDLVAPWRKRLPPNMTFSVQYPAPVVEATTPPPPRDSITESGATASMSPRKLLTQDGRSSAQERRVQAASSATSTRPASTSSQQQPTIEPVATASVAVQCNILSALQAVLASHRPESAPTADQANAHPAESQGPPAASWVHEKTAIAQRMSEVSAAVVSLVEALAPLTAQVSDAKLLHRMEQRVALVLEALGAVGSLSIDWSGATPPAAESTPTATRHQRPATRSRPTPLRPEELDDLMRVNGNTTGTGGRPPPSRSGSRWAASGPGDDMLRRTQSPPRPAFHHSLTSDIVSVRLALTPPPTTNGANASSLTPSFSLQGGSVGRHAPPPSRNAAIKPPLAATVKKRQGALQPLTSAASTQPPSGVSVVAKGDGTNHSAASPAAA